jgi:hypothetical protein
MGLAGCASTAPPKADGASGFLAENIPPWARGEPAQFRHHQHSRRRRLMSLDVPQARPVKVMDADEHKKLQSDLVALRNRSFAQGKAAQAIDPADLPAHGRSPLPGQPSCGVASRQREPTVLTALATHSQLVTLGDLIDVFRHSPTAGRPRR